jgi:small-conductance mechanosensitive channel
LIGITEAVLRANLAMGSLSISLQQVLVFLVAIWAAFAASQFLRFLLEEDVYYHWQLARGIPLAISTMVHYALLLTGFFVGLAVLGVDLTKVTILAGAFTVGVGFGLQTVINNFVCGLILLFERPIKVGDIIQIDTDIGEVRRIGIRACVIRTVDGFRSHCAKRNDHLQQGNQLDSIGLVPRDRSVSHRGSRRGSTTCDRGIGACRCQSSGHQKRTGTPSICC